MAHDSFPVSRPAKRRRLSPITSGSSRRTIAQSSYADDGHAGEVHSDVDTQEDPEQPVPTSSEGNLVNEDSDPRGLLADDSSAEEGEQKLGGVPLNGTSLSDSRQQDGQRAPSALMKERLHGATNQSTASNITTSTMMRSPIDELLQRVRPDYEGLQDEASEALKKLKTTIESIPARPSLILKDAEKALLKSHKVAIPFPLPRPASDVKYKFAYSRPVNVNVVGSYALKTATKADTGVVIDMVVNMPEDIFEVKDYLNYRYFHKRAYYLACLAAGLRSSNNIGFELSFDLLDDNALLPVIVAEPISSSSLFRIQIIPALSSNIFHLDKTLPDRNCVRLTNSTDSQNVKHPPTPYYNSSLRSNCAINGYLKLLHGASARGGGFRDASMLGSIWLKQRDLSTSVAEGGFGSFEWSALMALLLETGGAKGQPVLNPSHSTMQLFGATLHFLGQRDLLKNPLIIGSQSMPSIDSVPLLFDSTRSVNLLYKMTESSYSMLRAEAQAASRLFGSSAPSRLETLVYTHVAQPLLRYDLNLEVPIGRSHSHEQNANAQQLCHVLRHGLGDRITSIQIHRKKTPAWRVGVSRPSSGIQCSLGLVFDPTNAARSVDRGPSAEDSQGTTEFRAFWGDKAELRRFKDGEIRESLVWSTSDPTSVTREIVSYLLVRHLGLKSENDCVVVGNASHHVPLKADISDSEEDHKRVTAAFRLLETTIRGLDGLPLQVRQIQQSGGSLSSSTITSKASQSRHVPQIGEVVLQFEGSKRWPEDLTAVQMTKIAFLSRLAELLEQSSSVESARVGLENEASEILNKGYLDIAVSSFMFRLRIHHEREQGLIERRLADKTIAPRVREEAAVALADYKRIFVRMPLHTQTIQKVSTRFPAFAATVRLLKVWVSSQLLDNHFRPQLIELLAAKVFLEPQPWSVPSSALPAFLRTLMFLAKWEWQAEPLTLDSSGDLKKADVASIRTKFDAWRQIDPVMNRVSMFVTTSYDTDGITWTEHMPSKIVAARLSNLAQAAARLIENRGIELDIDSLFKPSLKEYDFVIRLRSPHGKKQSKQGLSNGTRYKNLQITEHDNLDRAGYDPIALYLDELQRTYGDAALFFCNTLDQDLIAGLWSPHTVRRRWKVSLGWSTMPVPDAGDAEDEGGTDVTINRQAMLAEMGRLGGDLVRSVET